MFYAGTLLPEEGNKRFELDESYGFKNEQRFTLQECLSGTAMYQRLCRCVMKHYKPVNDNTKSETQLMKLPFGKKSGLSSREALLKKLFRVKVLCGSNGLVMETLGWTQWLRLTALTKLN